MQLDNVCEGLDFCILGTTKNNQPSEDELKVMIRQHGGNVVINPSKYSGSLYISEQKLIMVCFTGAKTFICVAAAGTSLKVKQLMKTKSYNIATVDWLVRALGGETVKEKLLKFQPQDMICCTAEMEDAFTKRFDVYGDSFIKPTTIDNLKLLLKKIEFKVI